jgi:assimilatory nitrate reductase catalytic subunit
VKPAIATTCPYCGVGCGVSARVTGPRSVAITGDQAHPGNRGRLCSKGTHLGETVALDGRLLHPMVDNAPVSWDAALDEVASRINRTIAEHGPDSVAFYVSGQLLTEDYYVANKLMKGFIGSANIDTNSRLCMASAVAAHNRAFGEDVVPCGYDDLDTADLILLVGSNTAWCHPVIWQRIERARETRGTKIVVIDPRRTETAEQADLFVAVPPDGDVALFSALLHAMHARGLTDANYIADSVTVPHGFWQGLSPDHGIDPDVFAALVAHPRMITLFSQGANQSVCGTDKGNAIINLHLATGRIGLPGSGPFSITGQPNAMGGREVGGLANTLACHLGFAPAERADVAEFWQTDRLTPGPGLKAVDMFRAIDEGRIKFLWVMATNPAVSMPDAGFVRAALAKCPTVVVSDCIAGTDTAKFAHIHLPALGWGEKDGTVTNSERCISRQRALFAAPGEARADWAIMCDVAARMGHAAAFDFASPAAIFREYAAMTRLSQNHGKCLDLTEKAGITDTDYAAMAPFQWGGAHPLRDRFPTQDGRAHLIALSLPVLAETTATNPEFPLRLNTGRYRDQWHTMTRTGLSPTLSQHRREALLEIHPVDAQAHGLSDGGLARVVTGNGAAVFRVSVTTGQRQGDIFVPMHWSDMMAREARANRLSGQLVDPVSGQPAFKNTPARTEPLTPDWRAFLVTTIEAAPEAMLWWSRSRVTGGWLYELAGAGEIAADALLPEGQRLEVADAKRGMQRIAVRDADGALKAALYVTRTGQLPPRDWAAAQLGTTDAGPAELLAGRPSAPAPDRGSIVCICHGIGECDILDAANAGASSVKCVGDSTRAGTNCGSCRPAIARLLNSLVAEAAE